MIAISSWEPLSLATTSSPIVVVPLPAVASAKAGRDRDALFTPSLRRPPESMGRMEHMEALLLTPSLRRTRVGQPSPRLASRPSAAPCLVGRTLTTWSVYHIPTPPSSVLIHYFSSAFIISPAAPHIRFLSDYAYNACAHPASVAPEKGTRNLFLVDRRSSPPHRRCLPFALRHRDPHRRRRTRRCRPLRQPLRPTTEYHVPGTPHSNSPWVCQNRVIPRRPVVRWVGSGRPKR